MKPEVGRDWLPQLLTAAHTLPPAELPTLVGDAARSLGAREAVVYLADYEQATLMPLAMDGAHQPLAIDTTFAGRAFCAVDLLESSDGERLWVPILDGTERLGVLELVAPAIDDRLRSGAWPLSSLLALLLTSKTLNTDLFAVARRRKTMTLAAETQWELLPPLTFASSRVVISGMLEPSYRIGGDSFDYALNGDLAHLAILDAMGHGISASLLAAFAVSAYRHSRRGGDTLEEVYRSVDAALTVQFGTERFVTAQFAALDCATGELRWVNAGHPPPLLIRDGRVVGSMTCPPSLPLGLGGHVEAVAVEQLQPRDRVFLFSDGVVEARSAQGRFFGQDRLIDMLERETAAGLPAPETVRRLVRAVMEHHGGTVQDDATMLLVEWRGPDDPGPPEWVPQRAT
ncbi:MAG TPA: PP2C family protein-serine/threonine phosphatase [Egibacteraceae bacterium]|nr:PP2C family protein-serine/threonine phosphatase [Egibacteraceae bacterium]